MWWTYLSDFSYPSNIAHVPDLFGVFGLGERGELSPKFVRYMAPRNDPDRIGVMPGGIYFSSKDKSDRIPLVEWTRLTTTNVAGRVIVNSVEFDQFSMTERASNGAPKVLARHSLIATNVEPWSAPIRAPEFAELACMEDYRFSQGPPVSYVATRWLSKQEAAELLLSKGQNIRGFGVTKPAHAARPASVMRLVLLGGLLAGAAVLITKVFRRGFNNEQQKAE
jgi:hypothetical protein